MEYQHRTNNKSTREDRKKRKLPVNVIPKDHKTKINNLNITTPIIDKTIKINNSNKKDKVINSNKVHEKDEKDNKKFREFDDFDDFGDFGDFSDFTNRKNKDIKSKKSKSKSKNKNLYVSDQNEKSNELVNNEDIIKKYFDIFEEISKNHSLSCERLYNQIKNYIEVSNNSNTKFNALIESKNRTFENGIIDYIAKQSFDETNLKQEILTLNKNFKLQNESYELLVKELSKINNTKYKDEFLMEKISELNSNSKISNDLLMNELSKSKNNNKIPNQQYESLMNEILDLKNNSKVINEKLDLKNNTKIPNNQYESLINEILNLQNNTKIPNNQYESLMNEILNLQNNNKIPNNQYESLMNEILNLKNNSNVTNKILNLQNNYKNTNQQYESLIKEISNLQKSINHPNELLMKEISNLQNSINSPNELLMKEIIDIKNSINSPNELLMKEIIDIKNSNISFDEKIENLKLKLYVDNLKKDVVIDITSFNDWNKSDFDDEYNINQNLNIVHKKYFSENNFVKINKIASENLQSSSLSNILNHSFYNVLNKDFKNINDCIFKIVIPTTKQLLKLVKLSDESGKFIKYSYPPLVNDDKLKMLFDMMITGFNTQLNEFSSSSGILDKDKLKSQFMLLIEDYKSIIDVSNYDKLIVMISDIFSSIKILLKDNLPLLSWQQLMTKYFTMTNMINLTLKDVYENNDHDQKLINANIFVYDYHNLSRQISGFIELFYNIGVFLTIFTDIINFNKSDDIDNIDNIKIKSNDLKWWNEHIILIFDYHKALALNDNIISKQIENKLSSLEIHPNLTKMIDIYDNLINKDIYKVLNTVTH